MSQQTVGVTPINTTPSKEAFQELATSLGFPIQPQDEEDYLELLRGAVSDVETVQAMPAYYHPLIQTVGNNKERTYTVPEPSENPLNAWSHRTVIKGEDEGLLTGKTIAFKDNVSVAGLPLTGGTQPFHLSKDKPYPISTFDASVVSRVLEAGGTILGTSTCENYCMSALSFTSATGPVDNPWLKGYGCGGSSSGSAALVGIKSVREWKTKASGTVQEDGLGEGVDLAIGADQGASVRLPAAYSGIYGLKPTHGLVPYTGLTALHSMIDHCGPMAGSIRDTALFLAVIAGWDGLDPRMTPETPLRQNVPQYHDLLDKAIEARKVAGNWTPTTSAKGLRIGLIKEAWDAPQLSSEVASTVRKAGERFASLGGTVEEVSIPLHAMGAAIFTAATRADMADVFLYGKTPDCLSWPLPSLGPPHLDAKWYETINKSAPTVVNCLLSGEYMRRDRERFPLSARGKAVTHVHELRAAYDAALERFDVLITPANPTVGMRHPSPELSVTEKFSLALGNTWNTCGFNVTGHPGLAIPVGWGRTEDGMKLPIGMQMVGKRWGESDLFLAAAAWELGGFGLEE
ncbi:Amidase [Cytospora mali]|uniref:Amidase n=1 Tax=Cytospora mali TaxID=578113 RepID=A0A194W6U4_CYTMA|nr:Amidase [Valsa mali]